MNRKLAAWESKLAAIGAEKGFYKPLGKEHSALFIQGGSTLVVTFDNLDDARQDSDERLPWGSDFVVSSGWSSLGIMAHGWTWFRSQDVFAFFDRLRDEGFFARFDKVVFYGVSMGGYGATAFCASSPGATVLAMSPQATLDYTTTSDWEKRFLKGWDRNFTTPYGYAPDGAATAKHVYLFYDPLVREDAGHADMYTSDNTTKIRCRRFGHGLASSFMRMGVLKNLVRGIINDDIGPAEIHKIMRARRDTPAYQKSILKHLLNSDRPLMTYRFCRAILKMSKGGRPHFANAMRDAEAKLVAANHPIFRDTPTTSP